MVNILNYLALLDFTSMNTLAHVSGLPTLDVPDVAQPKKRLVALSAPTNLPPMKMDKQILIQNTPIQLTANDSMFA